MTLPSPMAVAAGSVPELGFTVQDAVALPFTAAPTLGFALRIDNPDGPPIRSVLLHTQLQIAARRRRYEASTQEDLFELFGAPKDWGTTLRTLLWTRTTLMIPAFNESTVVELPVHCSYDLEVAASRYFQALEDGTVPLEFLFTGTVFYAGPEGGLQVSHISWEREAEYRLPVATWKQAMDQHFPDSAWLRVRKDCFDRLSKYKSANALPSWEDAIDALLPPEGEG